MLKVHFYDREPDDDQETTCGKTPGSAEAVKYSRIFVQKTTDNIEETTCMTCLKRLYEGAVGSMLHHRREGLGAACRASEVSEQQQRLENL